ncbi:hypothetical protein Ancab_012262 [Ancistrocladus abbreviatus]
MENNLPMAKRLWNIVKVLLLMVKGICKRKLLMDLNMMMKRGKLAGKALGDLMFHHHHQHHHSSSAPREYEFSCSNTPSHYNFLPFHVSGKRKKSHYNSHQVTSTRTPPFELDEDVRSRVFELMCSNDAAGYEAAMSPILPGLGFGKSPMVRQLRITDSPFPLQYGGEEDNHVDQAAEEFIQKFYKQLKQQKIA